MIKLTRIKNNKSIFFYFLNFNGFSRFFDCYSCKQGKEHQLLKNVKVFFLNCILLAFISFALFPAYSNVIMQSPDTASSKLPPKAYLLDRLENLDRTLPKDYEGRTAIQLRMAHVLSLLSEEEFIKSKDCQACFEKSKMQAKKSLSLYKELLPIVSNSNQSFLQVEVLFQTAYLERFLGNKNQSLFQLKKITAKDNLRVDWMIRAWYGIGEIEFELYNYKKALNAFNQTLMYINKESILPDIAKPIIKELKSVDSKIKSISKTELSLNNKLSSWKFKSLYHKIWSLFNLSSYNLALNEMLSLISSSLYQSDSALFWMDKENQTLRKKLEKQMITIFSYSDITDENLKTLYGFKKQQKEENTLSQRNKRLSKLATVLKSMGRLKKSNQVWWFYLSKNTSKEEQLQAYFSIFTNKLSFTNKSQLLELGSLLEKVFTLQEQVLSLKRMSRQVASKQTQVRVSGKQSLVPTSQSDSLVVDQNFHNSIKAKIKEFFYQIDKSNLNTKQKNYLLSLYQIYNNKNPNDKDILLLSALLAEDLKKYQLAVNLLQQTVLSLNIKEDIESQNKEKLCVRQMELAELSKDQNTRLKAYDFYIQQGQKIPLKHKAGYQTAYLYHQDQEFLKSQPLFLKLAFNDFDSNKLSHPVAKNIRLQSAHLYLSSLIDQKDQEDKLIRTSGLFVKEFPKEKSEFIKIYNLAILNYVEKLSQGKKFSTSPLFASQDPSIQKAWSVLQLFDSQLSDKKNLETYHLNRMILAKELVQIDDMNDSLKFLLSHKQSSKENKKTALQEQLWLSELTFDFDHMLELLKKLHSKNQSQEHALRLVRVAELSNKNPSSYYEDFIKQFEPSQSVKLSSIKSQLVASSKPSSVTHIKPVELESFKSILISWLEISEKEKQKQLLKTYHHLFRESPDELLYWVLKVDAGDMDLAFLNFFSKKLLKDNSFISGFLKRKQDVQSFKKALSFKKRDPKKVASRQMARVIKSYSNQIMQLEKKAVSFLKTEDWMIHVFVTGYLMKETKDFYNFVFQLPIPKGLTEVEQADYKKLLVKQMQVYVNKIQELENKQKQLFSSNFLKTYQKMLENFVFHPYLKWELTQISEFLNEKDQKEIQSFISQIENDLTRSKSAQLKKSELKKINSQLEKVYKELRSNPFDTKNIKLVLELEKQRNNTVRVHYISNRIKQLESNQQTQKDDFTTNQSKNKVRGG